MNARLSIVFRPLLIHGMLGDTPTGPVILIDSESSPEQQVITLWHETLHMIQQALGVENDEQWVEQTAQQLAKTVPGILDLWRKNNGI